MVSDIYKAAARLEAVLESGVEHFGVDTSLLSSATHPSGARGRSVYHHSNPEHVVHYSGDEPKGAEPRQGHSALVSSLESPRNSHGPG